MLEIIKEEKDNDAIDASNAYIVTNILPDYENQSHIDRSRLNNEMNQSTNYNCGTKNDSTKTNKESLLEIEISLSNNENNLLNNSSDVSDSDVFVHSYDTNDANLTDVKDDNCDISVTSSKVKSNRKLGKMKGHMGKKLNSKGVYRLEFVYLY